MERKKDVLGLRKLVANIEELIENNKKKWQQGGGYSMKIVENRKEAEAKDNSSIVLKSYSTVISFFDFDGYWNIK